MKDERKQLDYLEEERKKIWSKLVALEEAVNDRPSDIEKEAMQASKKASEYRNRAEESKNSAFESLGEIKAKVEEVSNMNNISRELHKEIQEYCTTTKEIFISLKTSYDELIEKKTDVDNHILEIETTYEDLESLEEKIEALETIFKDGNENAAKLEVLNKSILTRKNEIDKLYYDIIGYTEKDKDENLVIVPGKKAELEDAYAILKESLLNTEKDLAELKTATEANYSEFEHRKEAIFNDVMNERKKEFRILQNQIEELLPNALTAGLSHAYSKKKEEEIEESKRISKNFSGSIWGLVCISLIPFSISLVSLFQGDDLKEVIFRMPRAVLSILPLYIPVLWVAYSANKKMNLSKRLSEEYAHKEVLSKTFEGLSNQINNIENKEVSTDLRNKLLYNILEVSAENPGKLISDYNKSDHPLMDALDKSVKLANVVDKLARIPGFAKLSKSIDKRSKNILVEKDKSATNGLEFIEKDQEEEMYDDDTKKISSSKNNY
jgi:hypothetical protein